jgi:hypothetical protein
VSDVLLRANMQAELVAALTGITGVVDVIPGMSLERLHEVEDARTPLVGVFAGSSRPTGDVYGVGKKHVPAESLWEIGILVQERDLEHADAALWEIVAEVHDRIQHLKSSAPYSQLWRWVSDDRVLLVESDIYGAVVTFSLKHAMCN